MKTASSRDDKLLVFVTSLILDNLVLPAFDNLVLPVLDHLAETSQYH